MLYTWSGPETPLGSPTCMATYMTVEEISDRADGTKKATGSLSYIDYVENCRADDRWEATGTTELGGTLSWTVRRVVEKGSFCWSDRAGTPLFTLAGDINEGIDAFIKEHLTIALALSPSQEPPPRKALRKVYRSDSLCWCSILGQKAVTFERLTRFSFVPTEGLLQNCYTCSCGKNWWLPKENDGRWVPVLDTAAWEMLTTNDGEAVRAVGALEDGIYLLQTLRDRGLIPMG